MGTLDRSRCEYRWDCGSMTHAVSWANGDPSPVNRELVRLAGEVEDLKENLRDRPSFVASPDFVARTLKRNADLENANARQEATIKSLREQLLVAHETFGSRSLSAYSDEQLRDAMHAPGCGGRSQYKGICSCGVVPRPQVSYANPTRDLYRRVEISEANLADHGAILKTHESRLDAMEEVFDKIKDAL